MFREDQMKGVALLLALSLAWIALSPGRTAECRHGETLVPAVGETGVVAAFRGDEDREGVYGLPEGSAVRDLLRAAGWKPPVGIDGTVLERTLREGDRVTPLKGPDGRPLLSIDAMPAAAKLVFGLPVDLNGASYDDLTRIPGIGKKTAEAILRYRETAGPLKSLEDLKEITTLGDRKISEMGKYAFAGPGKVDP